MYTINMSQLCTLVDNFQKLLLDNLFILLAHSTQYLNCVCGKQVTLDICGIEIRYRKNTVRNQKQ